MRRFLNVLYADLRRLVRLPAFWLLLLCFALLSPLPLLLKLSRLLSGHYRGFDATDGLLSFLPFIGLALAILLPFYLYIRYTRLPPRRIQDSIFRIFLSREYRCP